MVGCSLGRSRIWFTLGFGIVNEVYYPRVDRPQIRDLGFIVGDGRGFWVEVKRLQNYTVRLTRIAHSREPVAGRRRRGYMSAPSPRPPAHHSTGSRPCPRPPIT